MHNGLQNKAPGACKGQDPPQGCVPFDAPLPKGWEETECQPGDPFLVSPLFLVREGKQ